MTENIFPYLHKGVIKSITTEDDASITLIIDADNVIYELSAYAVARSLDDADLSVFIGLVKEAK